MINSNMETYYYLYRITNLVNGKIYVGAHKTNDLDDGYMGSGLLIRRAIDKYGIENFEKTILQYFNSAEEAFKAESQVVNEEFVADSSTYNLKEGGHGGWDHMNDGSSDHINRTRKCAIETNEKYRHRLKTDPEFREYVFQLHSECFKRLHKEGKLKYDNFTGKRHTNESKAKIGAANSKHQSGSGNSQYGKMWIYSEDLKECKRIPKGDPIPEGWKQGRKMKF